MTKLRYELGKKYYFVDVIYDRPQPLFTSLYVPWIDTLKEVKIHALECVEHHKVPVEWQDNASADGFIFQNIDGQKTRWFNQYPTASYGQASNDEDFKVRVGEQNDGTPVVADAKVFSENESLWGLWDVTKYLNEIHRGLHPKKAGDALPPNERDALQGFYDQLKSKLAETMEPGWKVTLEEVIIGSSGEDREPRKTGIYVHKIVQGADLATINA